MEKINQQETRALAVIRSHPEFKKFMEWLERSHEKAIIDMSNADTDIKVGRAQGEFTTLNTILGKTEEASEILEKMRDAPQKIQRARTGHF